MATQADVRRIALALPGTVESTSDFSFAVPNKGKLKGYVWVWKERVVPKKPRIPNHSVLAVRVASLVDKDLLLKAEPTKFFTEPHYDGYPAILVRLAEVKVPELRALMKEAWRCLAPRELVDASESAKPARARKPAAKRKK
jgi:hypothetical protein